MGETVNKAVLRRAAMALMADAATKAGLATRTPGNLDDQPAYKDAMVIQQMLQSHRHERTSWLIAGGYIEWCYHCGAWRNLSRNGENTLTADGPWHRPSGGPNPAMKGKPK